MASVRSIYTNQLGGATAGFSLRENLVEKQGVTLEETIRFHLEAVYELTKVFPSLRINRYRVDANNPNEMKLGEFVQ